jgi:hypothetical protein
MTISAVILFGSHARTDAEAGSDVDILGITAERKTRHVEMGTVSLYLYPWKRLLAEARNGDLFVCHIVKEARPLHDPKSYLKELSTAFIFKPSYSEEVRKASDLAWYLIHFHEKLDQRTVAKRIAWCVRTIVIARSAENRTPYFAAAALTAFSKSSEVGALISRKEDRHVEGDSLFLLRDVLSQFGDSDPMLGPDSAYLKRFAKTKNKVALQTIRGLWTPSEYAGSR